MEKTFTLKALRRFPNRRTGQVRGSISVRGRIVVPTAFQDINGLADKCYYMLYFDPHIQQGENLRQILAVTFHDKDGEGYYRLQRVKGTGYVEIRSLLREEGFEILKTGKVELTWDSKQKALFIDLTQYIRYRSEIVAAADKAQIGSFRLDQLNAKRKKRAGRPRK